MQCWSTCWFEYKELGHSVKIYGTKGQGHTGEPGKGWGGHFSRNAWNSRRPFRVYSPWMASRKPDKTWHCYAPETHKQTHSRLYPTQIPSNFWRETPKMRALSLRAAHGYYSVYASRGQIWVKYLMWWRWGWFGCISVVQLTSHAGPATLCARYWRRIHGANLI